MKRRGKNSGKAPAKSMRPVLSYVIEKPALIERTFVPIRVTADPNAGPKRTKRLMRALKKSQEASGLKLWEQDGMIGGSMTPPRKGKPGRKVADKTLEILTAAAKRVASGRRYSDVAYKAWPHLPKPEASRRLSTLKSKQQDLFDSLVEKYSPNK